MGGSDGETWTTDGRAGQQVWPSWRSSGSPSIAGTSQVLSVADMTASPSADVPVEPDPL